MIDLGLITSEKEKKSQKTVKIIEGQVLDRWTNVNIDRRCGKTFTELLVELSTTCATRAKRRNKALKEAWKRAIG